MSDSKKKEPKKKNVKDLDALSAMTPEREEDARYIKFLNKEYRVIAFNDLPYEESLEILVVEEVLEKGKTYAEQAKSAMRYVEILVPSMPEEVRNRLSGRQLTELALYALGEAQAPPKGNEADSDSGT